MKFKDILKLHGTYIFCPRCGSPAVTHSRPNVAVHPLVYTEYYGVECKQCGLKGDLKENWRWSQDDTADTEV